MKLKPDNVAEGLKRESWKLTDSTRQFTALRFNGSTVQRPGNPPWIR